MVTMKRCTKCILPENYPGITFNEEDICNHCITYRARRYLGGKALKEEIAIKIMIVYLVSVVEETALTCYIILQKYGI
jgi:hypothetical protein